MPLSPGGDADLQCAIYLAVTDGTAPRRRGRDRTAHHKPARNRCRPFKPRLAKPLVPEPEAAGTVGGDTTGTSGTPGGGTELSGSGQGGQSGGSTALPAVTERQVTFALRTGLSSAAPKETLYALLHELADRVDDG